MARQWTRSKNQADLPMAEWQIPKSDRQRMEKLIEQFRLPEFITSILINRGIDTSEKIQHFTKSPTLKPLFTLLFQGYGESNPKD